jgi:peptidoglycan/xylan/chitin deacetylase (PgdA/CDA1 family)
MPLMSTDPGKTVCLRIDDIGASSKRYEVYSDYAWGWRKLKLSGNFLFLKYISPFKKWGPYREMTASEWREVFGLLEKHHAKLTVAITAAWAADEHTLIPFPKRFPDEAAALREGVQQGLLEIANHGLTHCVLQDNAFKPKLFSGNRAYHREFWEWVPPDIHDRHLRHAQEILQNYFQTTVVTFVPPGNVLCAATLVSARHHGLQYVSMSNKPAPGHGMCFVDAGRVVPFHDRDIVLQGTKWLEALLQRFAGSRFCFIKDAGAALPPA